MIENLGVTQNLYDAIDLSDNKIKKLENFPRMERLSVVVMNNNWVSRIAEGLGRPLPNLEVLVLCNNRISQFAQIVSGVGVGVGAGIGDRGRGR